ncbi:MAG TPA: TonB-dependent receptor [Steroidobacteraceae bacterium]|nr:TonB-dependent receptor [Steroidobacteraceae bacterium]
MQSFRVSCAALWAGLAFISVASAQDGERDEGDVVVTASRVDEAIDAVVWSTTVLDREAIEARQAESFQDLLAGLAGVDVDNAGGLGKATSVLLRGGEGDHTLLLIDGVRVGSATLGTPPVELVPPDQIERIEVVRGPRSTLYGSDAVGGVIQIFTRRPLEPGLTGRASVTSGSHDLRSAAVDLGSNWGSAWLGIGAAATDTDGFNACLGRPFPPGGGCFTDEPDADGYRSRSGSFAAGRRFGDDWSAELRALLVEGAAEFDGTFVNVTETTETVASLRVDGKLGDRWRLRVNAGRNDDEQSNLRDGIERSRFDTSRDLGGVQLDGPLGAGLTLVTGCDLLRDRIDSTTVYDESSRTATGFFGELHADAGRISWLAGARYEENEQFGSHVMGNLAAAVVLGAGVRATASWGTAFRAPTFNELYFPGFGNPLLEPEESQSFEVGLQGRRGAGHWAINVHETGVDQLISFDVGTFLSENIADARIRGAELQAGWRGQAWSAAGQITLLDTESRSNDANRGNELPRRAGESASLELRRMWGATEVGALGRWAGARYSELANTTRLGGYFTLDVTAQHSFARAWTLQARAANLLDRDYTTAALYVQDGRHYSVTLRYQPQGAPR